MKKKRQLLSVEKPLQYLPVSMMTIDKVPIVLLEPLPSRKNDVAPRYSVEVVAEMIPEGCVAFLRGFLNCDLQLPSNWIVTIWPRHQPVPADWKIVKPKQTGRAKR